MLPHTYQDESRSISENSTWGIRRRFEQGKLHVNHTKFLGYDKDADGNLIINEKQAKIVRRIYQTFLDGKGANQIARELSQDMVPSGMALLSGMKARLERYLLTKNTKVTHYFKRLIQLISLLRKGSKTQDRYHSITWKRAIRQLLIKKCGK